MAQKKTKTTQAKKPVIKLKTWHYLLLLAWPAIIFGRALTFGFVMHDDDKMILENPMIRKGVDPKIAFTTDAWFMDARIELYRPWQSITYMLDYSIGKEKPFIYHLHNLLIFILGTYLLFIFLKFYFKPILAWAGAMLYSMNLLTPHATGWIAARGDLYLMVFGLGFLILLLRYLRNNSTTSLWWAIPVFLMALFSKESAVALLPIAAVMIYIERGKLPSAKEWGWLAANGIAFVIYYLMRKGAIADAGNLSAKAFFSNLRSFGEELFKMVIPLGFSVMPGYNMIWTVAGLVLIIALILLLRKFSISKKLLWIGAAILLFSLLPSMMYEPSFAGVAYDYLDHRAWFPYVGVWMMILGIIDQSKIWSGKNAPVWFGALLLIWSGVNFWRIGTYANWESYYSNAIATNPGSGLANLNYGSMLRDEGKWASALSYVEKGVKLSPDYTDAKVRLAEVYFNLKRYTDAVNIATEALKKEPRNVSALQFRGSANGAGGNPSMAEQDFRAILEIEPNNTHALFNIAMAYKDLNQDNEAIQYLTKLISVQQDFPNAYFERGFIYGRTGQFAQAKADMDMSISYQPQHAGSYFFRGRAYDALGNLEAACGDWRKALELGAHEAEQFVKTKCGG